MHDFCFTFPYGALVAIGGLVGFMRKGSVTSLAGGLGAGFFLLLAAQMSLNAFNQRRNSYLALFIQTVCSFALTWVMGQRYLVTSKIMPGGVVATISAIMTFFYLYKIIRGGNHIAPRKD
ncbi:protein FATTY ACID EXPORT 5 [Cryptomeria japonica]|uniref:protein FATTY ACID EXPORT 5 n=1 Tax=Cryptomeria japonica TaxID=3369 RepID=UPI0025AC89C4|nr:protein FATTY ACID EXPORT 5 [Cryptomeria japonica]